MPPLAPDLPDLIRDWEELSPATWNATAGSTTTGFRRFARTARSNLPALVELVFSNPFVTAARFSARSGLTLQGSRNVIKDAVARGWLVETDSKGRGGRVYWVAADVFAIIDAPWKY